MFFLRMWAQIRHNKTPCCAIRIIPQSKITANIGKHSNKMLLRWIFKTKYSE